MSIFLQNNVGKLFFYGRMVPFFVVYGACSNMLVVTVMG